METSAFFDPIDIDNVIYSGITEDATGEYNHDIGSGWIFHFKATRGWGNSRFEKSLGWLYIRNYPWVYGSDWGWRYTFEAGTAWNANAWWFYEEERGWFWTNRDVYPQIFTHESGWTQYE